MHARYVTPLLATALSTVGLLDAPAVRANTLFGVDGITDQLVRIDQTTGAGTAIGPLGFGLVGALAYDPNTNTLYGIDGVTDVLLNIDTKTGTASLVGSLTLAVTGQTVDGVAGLAYDPNTSTLYAVNPGDNTSPISDNLLTIDASNGVASAVGPLGFGDVTGLSFDPTTGQLFGVEWRADKLLTIDTAGGTATPAPGSLGFGDAVAIAVHPVTGVIYGVDDLSNQLFTIDPVTGAGTVVGPLGFNGILGLAFAFDSEPPLVYWTAGHRGGVWRSDLGGAHIERVGGPLQSGRHISLDRLHNRMYWVDSSTGQVLSSELDGAALDGVSLLDVTPSGVDFASAVAVDALDKKIYVTDSATPQIVRADLDGAKTEVLVQAIGPSHKGVYVADLGPPGAIALDVATDPFGAVTRGDIDMMYWTDGGVPAGIWRAETDGSNAQRIVHQDNFPNAPFIQMHAIVLDLQDLPQKSKVCWRDMSFLLRCNLDGASVEMLGENLQFAPVSNFAQDFPYDLGSQGALAFDADDQKLYWPYEETTIRRASLEAAGIANIEDVFTVQAPHPYQINSIALQLQNTPAGNGIIVEPRNAGPELPSPMFGDPRETPVLMTFDEVRSGGNTSVAAELTEVSASRPWPPVGYEYCGRYMDIETTATFSGAVELCYKGAFCGDPADQPDLWRYIEIKSDWEQLGGTRYEANGTVCGSTTSLSLFAPLVNTDPDEDGIANRIDLEPNTPSDEFSTGLTAGMIVQRGDQVLSLVADPIDLIGVTIHARPGGGPGPAEVVIPCDDVNAFWIDAGDEVTITCGSVNVEVAAGPVEATFHSGDVVITATLGTGFAVHFDPDALTLTAPPSNPGPLVVTVDGVEVAVVPGQTASVRTNQPPIANAGEDLTVECVAADATTVELDGSASSDPDKDELSFEWRDAAGNVIATGAQPTVELPFGSHTLTLVVSDGDLQAIDEVVVDIVDTTPPQITLVGDDPTLLELGTPTTSPAPRLPTPVTAT